MHLHLLLIHQLHNTALINFVPDADAKSNEETMLEEIKNVKTGQITYAVRDTKIDEKEIHEGDIMGIGDSGILSVGTEVEATALLPDLQQGQYSYCSEG